MPTTPLMQLIVPTVGVTAGPSYATLLSSIFDQIDAHDHTSGKGTQIPTAGINVNADLSMNSNALVSIKHLGIQSLDAAPSISSAIYSDSVGNLYYKNSSGSEVQITDGAAVNSSGSGILSYFLPLSYPYSVVAGNGQQVLGVDTSTGAKVINLPAATVAITVYIKDIGGNAGTNNISIVPNGSDEIDGANATLVVDDDKASITLISDGTSSWYVI